MTEAFVKIFKCDCVAQNNPLKAMTEQAKNNSAKVKKIMELYGSMETQIHEITHPQYTVHLLDAIFDRLMFEISDFVKRTGIHKLMAMRLLRWFRFNGILHEIRPESVRCANALYGLQNIYKLFCGLYFQSQCPQVEFLFLLRLKNFTRQTIVKILNDSRRLKSFKNTSQKFIKQVATIIYHQMRFFMIDGIEYHKIDDDHYYAQGLFGNNGLFGFFRRIWLKECE